MSELEQILRAELVKSMTCPRCDTLNTDGWCAICGDRYPWPRRDEPIEWATPRGISGLRADG